MSNPSQHIQQALVLARRALGSTSPNPAVGAVVVKDGTILGEGYTLPPGQAHAEVVALQQAGEGTHGASLYVTLEPCCVEGRTPPCTEAIVSAGIGEVHVAAIDPNPSVRGWGLAQLEATGIEVHTGEGEEEARELYEAFAKHITTGLPFATVKFAMSLDGKIATHSGDSKWVTGGPAREYVQEMRRGCDAIVVGVNTVLLDDPRLTVRDRDGVPAARQPLRVILDSQARTPSSAQLLKEPGATLIAVTQPPENDVARLAEAGAEVLALPPTVEGMVDPCALLRRLGERGAVSVLVEGGGRLLGSLFDLGEVDKVVAFIAPKIIGGLQAPSPIGGAGHDTMSLVQDLERVTMDRIGEDILVVGYPPGRVEFPTFPGSRG